MKLRNLLQVMLLWCSVLAANDASAALGCSITPAPPTMIGTYAPASNLDMQGLFTINCTRVKADAKNWTVWVGMTQLAGETLNKSAPYADTLTYGVYRDAARASLWTNGAAVPVGAGGLAVAISFQGNNLADSATAPFYMRAPSGQNDKAAGTYNDTLNVTLRVTNNAGAILDTATVSSQATVAKTCSFGVSAVSYSLNYQAFRSSDLNDTLKSVTMTCSKGTPFDLALDQTVGVIPTVQLRYRLVFTTTDSANVSSTSTTGTTAQTFFLTLRLPAGQAGTCATGTCSGNTVRQITVTY